MAGDRLKGPLRAIARRADPLQPYRCMYRARLIVQSADRRRVDVQPEDPLLPPMSNIPLKHGVPGMTVLVRPGAHLLVGWENARPDIPFAALWADGADVLAVSIVSELTELGGSPLVPLVDGALTGQSIDPFTGMQHWMLGNSSPFVLVKKNP